MFYSTAFTHWYEQSVSPRPKIGSQYCCYVTDFLKRIYWRKVAVYWRFWNTPDYVHAGEITLTKSEFFRIKNIIPALDLFIKSLDEYLKAYAYVSNRFGFFQNFEELNVEDIKSAAEKLCFEYNNDVDKNL